MKIYYNNYFCFNNFNCALFSLQVDTPDSVLQSGLGLGPDMGHTILRSMVDPRDYDRLRYLQMNGGQPNSFEETIHRVSFILFYFSKVMFKTNKCIFVYVIRFKTFLSRIFLQYQMTLKITYILLKGKNR